MPKQKKTKTVKRWGVYIKAYGGIIEIARTKREATKLLYEAYGEVSMLRSISEFSVIPITITYKI